jgi:four helix bundle protein
MRDFRQLRVWTSAHELTLAVYRATRAFPNDERYGLTAQIRRAAASIGANIAEGCGRRSRKDLSRFLVIASGSASELDYHLILAVDLKLLDGAACKHLADRLASVRRMLATFIRKIASQSD